MTGGCRRLGAAIAVRLAQAGWDLALHAHHDIAPTPKMAAVLAAANARFRVAVADFADLAAAEALLPAVVEQWGRAPDLLVNSASLFGQDRLADTTPAALAEHYAVNCAAPALLTQHFAALAVPARADGERSVINIVDQRIVRPHGDQFAYTLSKMALAGLTEIAARVLAPAIRVNAVAPGLTMPTEDYSPELINRLRTMMPLHRLPSPDDIGDAVLYLAGARSVTGQVLFVDAGARLTQWDGDFTNLDA
ncbi:SDR family oxidoreductase [uncultured Sphingomonas sp.]|uniref:SDR family oxidoreductase n=1 Tax=uncultured Sphingomonas sp. TaxID=158754 RepID=UPI0035CBF877